MNDGKTALVSLNFNRNMQIQATKAASEYVEIQVLPKEKICQARVDTNGATDPVNL